MDYSLPIPFDLATLRLIWWFLLGVIVSGFCIMEGFDMGIGMLLPFLSRGDIERRIMINSIGPVWEGNQVWLILGAGAAFAAWPYIYVVCFSGLYIPLFMVLFALILRPVGFKFRSKIDNTLWKQLWDGGIFIGSFVPSLVLGIGVGAFLQGGFPFHFDSDMRMVYTGSFLELFNLTNFIWGLFFVALFIRHGGYFLALKTMGALHSRTLKTAQRANIICILLLVLALWMTLPHGLKADHTLLAPQGPSNPLYKVLSAITAGTWLSNVQSNGLERFTFFYALPVLFAFSLMRLMARLKPFLAFTLSSLNIFTLIATFGWLTFPIMLPSSTHPAHSLLVWDASSSKLNLFVMLIAAGVFVPIILAYTSWVYKVLAGPIRPEDITQNTKEVY